MIQQGFGEVMGQLIAIHSGMADPFEESHPLQYADLQYGIGMQQADTAGGVVTVVENEVYTECQDNGLIYEPGDFGEHLTVEWVALDTLQMGDVIFFEDEAQIEVMGPYHIPDWVDNLETVLRVVNEPVGIQGKVISGGTITVDMMVHVELQTSEENY